MINDVVFALQVDKITPENTAKDLNWHPIKKVDLPTENIPSNGKVTYQEILQQEEVLYRLSKKHIATDSTICNLPEGLKRGASTLPARVNTGLWVELLLRVSWKVLA